MEAKLAEKDGSELDREIEKLDHFKSIQQHGRIDRRCTEPRRGSFFKIPMNSRCATLAHAELGCT